MIYTNTRFRSFLITKPKNICRLRIDYALCPMLQRPLKSNMKADLSFFLFSSSEYFLMITNLLFGFFQRLNRLLESLFGLLKFLTKQLAFQSSYFNHSMRLSHAFLLLQKFTIFNMNSSILIIRWLIKTGLQNE